MFVLYRIVLHMFAYRRQHNVCVLVCRQSGEGHTRLSLSKSRVNKMFVGVILSFQSKCYFPTKAITCFRQTVLLFFDQQNQFNTFSAFIQIYSCMAISNIAIRLLGHHFLYNSTFSQYKPVNMTNRDLQHLEILQQICEYTSGMIQPFKEVIKKTHKMEAYSKQC